VTLWVAAPRSEQPNAARVEAAPLVGGTNGIAIRGTW
jgi:hypothetical protein